MDGWLLMIFNVTLSKYSLFLLLLLSLLWLDRCVDDCVDGIVIIDKQNVSCSNYKND